MKPNKEPPYRNPEMSTGELLLGRVALITGGTSGIGEATARLFAKHGARVAITGRRQSHGEQVIDLIRKAGGEALYIPADHTRAEDCARSVETVLEAFGRVDILFNNAGVVLFGSAEETTEEQWQHTFDLNVTAVWRMCKLVLPHMRRQKGGVIVNNASDWGLVGGANAVVYCASKGAVVQMTRAMALDHAHENIRINAVCPGDTFVQRWIEQGYFKKAPPKDITTLEVPHIPMRRYGLAEEIAQAVLFLASDMSSYMTGATLVVDGGNTAQ